MSIRSLYAGVSGLRGLQTAIDVIGNNIANVNTIGFKAGRVTFADLFSQTLGGAQGAQGGRGGINARQVGLGVKVGSIDNIFTQGSIQTTNRLLDLAIQGNGFFQLTNGTGLFYTRAGNFTLDEEGYITSPGTGYRVIGLTADQTGVISPTATPGTVRIVLGQSAAAEITDNVTFGGNLNSSDTPDVARSLSTLVSLYDYDGNALQLRNGDVLQVTEGRIRVGGVVVYDVATDGPINILTVDQSTTLHDLSEALKRALQIAANNSTTLDVDFNADGTMSFSTGAGERLEGLRFGVENELGRDMSALRNIFTGMGQFTRDITVAEASVVQTQFFRQPDATTSIDVFDSQGNARTMTVTFARNTSRLAAELTTALADLRDREGNQLFPPTLPSTAVIRVNNINGAGTFLDIGVSGMATLNDLLTRLGTRITAALPGAVGNVTFQLNPDGSLQVTNNSGVALGSGAAPIQFSVVEDPAAAVLVENRALGEILAAADTGRDEGLVVADGGTVTTNLLQRTQQIRNEWNYAAIVPFPPQAQVDTNELGTIVFNSNGQFQGFLRTDALGNPVIQTSPPVLTFDPDGAGPRNDGVDALTITLRMSALTQNAAPTTAAMESQDGSPVGELQSITINDLGIITGIFSNGTSRTLAQVLLAIFPNEEGLVREGDSLFRESANSGEAVIGQAGTRSRGSIRSTTLELSNVDLAAEFTNLIVSQRAFQANTRIITTGDTILNEVVNLVR